MDTFVKIGASGAEMGLSWLLQRIVGATRAAEVVLTGRRVDGEEAARIGLVLETVPDGQVVDAALALADQIISNTPMGTWMGKATLWSNLGDLQPRGGDRLGGADPNPHSRHGGRPRTAPGLPREAPRQVP